MLPSRGSETISPTAHYTGEVWSRNNLSTPGLATTEGRIMFLALEPLMRVSRAFGGPSFEPHLLARHRAIDMLLERTITERGVAQVVEVACGMSPRGWRFTSRHGTALTYIEADLPAMAARKRSALERIGSLGERHRVAELDVLADGDLEELVAPLDPELGLVIITEGLLSYLPGDALADIWRRFAATLAEFDVGIYLSDLHVAGDGSPLYGVLGTRLLSSFVRSPVSFHFDGAHDAIDALLAAGFKSASVDLASSYVDDGAGDLVRVVAADAR